MNNLPFFLAILILFGFCRSGKIKLREPGQPLIISPAIDPHGLDNIGFDYTYHYKTGKNSLAKLEAVLYNQGVDTVYFLSRSCDGFIYQLQYDRAVMELDIYSVVQCNASWPIIVKIAPGGQLKFGADFILKKSKSKIRLGFDMPGVPRNFNLAMDNVDKFNNGRQKNVIWAKERII